MADTLARVTADDVVAKLEEITESLPGGGQRRHGQIEMTKAVSQAIADRFHLVARAGTGTGKSLAYLVPAVMSGRTTVIATATKALQDQLAEKDLPFLAEHLDLDWAILKGRANYVCRQRLLELADDRQMALEGVVGHDLDAELDHIVEWSEETTTGDRAELRAEPSNAAWSAISVTSDECPGVNRCPSGDACFAEAARREAAEADLIVVNTHLYGIDLATDGAILPDHEVAIIDEAHQLEDTATLFFGTRLSVVMFERLARDARSTLAKIGGDSDAGRLLDSVLQRASNFFEALPARSDGGRAPLLTPDIPEEALFALDNALTELGAACRNARPSSETLLQVARRSDAMRNALGSLEQPGQVSWVQGRGRTSSVGSSPIDVGPLLKERLHERVPALVFTSATLATAGNFKFVKRRLGLPEEISEELVDSPFRYDEQAALYAPSHLPDPRRDDYVQAASEEILSLINMTKGGAFVLCTSIRMMKRLAESCREALDYPVRVQGEAPKTGLLDWFRKDGNAVLFATASFWEGVDVPGSALRLVILDKLPFDVPSDPVIQARCKRLDEAGESSFMRYLVPSAALSLKQGFGRLIRSGKDQGVVAILDSRIRRRGYGKVLIKSLPPARVCSTFAEVQAFWQGLTVKD